MSVSLHEVRPLNAPIRAAQLSALVNGENVNQTFRNTGAIERYSTMPKALKNAFRLATAEGLHTYVVKERKSRRSSPIGIGTIIKLNTYVDPTGQVVSGMYDLDYWLTEDATTDLHDKTAMKLMNEAKHVARRDKRYDLHTGERAAGKYFNFGMIATIDEDSLTGNLGLARQMRPTDVVQPHDQAYDIGLDVYGVSRPQMPAQLLYERAKVLI